MPKKQKSGLYRTKVKVGTKPDGTDLVKWISGRTKAELEANRRAVMEFYVDGAAAQRNKMFGEYAVEWYRVSKEPHVSDSSRNAYRSMLNRHILPVFGNRNLRAIRSTELQSFINEFAGKSSSHIAVLMACIKGIFESALSDGYIDRNVTLKLRRPDVKASEEKRALTLEERTKVLEVAHSHVHGLYLAVMFYLGLRPGEARGLMWEDFDMQNSTVHIQRDIDFAVKGNPVGTLKTASSDRIIPVPEGLRKMIEERGKGKRGFLFVGDRLGKQLSPSTAKRWWIMLMQECGFVEEIPEGEVSSSNHDLRSKYRPTITPHSMRHNFITMCWENGMDVFVTMKLVGHAEYQTTMNIYTHLSNEGLVRAKADLDSMFEI